MLIYFSVDDAKDKYHCSAAIIILADKDGEWISSFFITIDHLQRQLLLPVVITISFLLIGAMITTAAIIMWTTRTKWLVR